MLCISGRTSRISSVGSQGSAVSRLSAVSGISGVSRSPSPHKMLLETSFCGPKPLNSDAADLAIAGDTITTDELEQIILARKHDLTKAVLAEGINIDLSTPKKIPKPTKSAKSSAEANGNLKDAVPEKTVKRTQIITDKNAASLARTNSNNKNQPIKKGGVLKKNNCTIVGVTPSGTQVNIIYKIISIISKWNTLKNNNDTLQKLCGQILFSSSTKTKYIFFY